MEPLKRDLDAEHIPQETTSAIAEAFWGRRPLRSFWKDENQPQTAPLDPYFRYYAKQCFLIALHDNGKYSSLATHQDIADTAALLKQGDQSREDILRQLPAILGHGTPEQNENAMLLASRLLLMMRIGEVPHEFRAGRHVEWKQGPLKNFVHGYFPDQQEVGHEGIKFEKAFNALSLGLIADMKIQWTDNLADHLRLINYDKVLCVFHHATFLHYQETDPMFPPAFIEETLRTLALLFPKYDKKLRAWYNAQATKHDLDPTIVDCGQLIADERQIESFKYWHDRLVVLKQVFDESKPSTISQWWHDRRNSVQWYTFWVALVVLALTIFFGLVQSIEGALQVYASFHTT